MNSFTQVMCAWPKISLLADDAGVDIEAVRGWRKRDSIPARYWKKLLDKAPERNIEISPEILIDLAARS